jgi:nicotinate phosphoribosyltransferase
VEAFGDEAAAFEAFARDQPGSAVLLVDTYDTLSGARRAVEVMHRLGLPANAGVRLDSGDLAALSVQVRRLLDDAGRRDATVVASGGLDEYAVDELRRAGAPIDVFAVGTRVGTSADAPYLDSAYKLVEYEGRPVLKLSPGKATRPGRKQVFRAPGAADLLAVRDEPAPPGSEPLLVPVVSAGRRLLPPEDLAVARSRLEADLAWLPEQARRVRDPRPPHVRVSAALEEATAAARRAVTFAPGR